MRHMIRGAALGLVVALAACAPMPETASRNASFTPPAVEGAGVLPQSISVSQINVAVPYSLRISESNTYYPLTDIVWRGDPIGDRRAQIRALFETAFAAGTRDWAGDTPLAVDVTLKRFHALTDRVRLSVGGAHHMVFDLTVRDARTGEILMPTREINRRLKAYGGLRAVMADKRGQTQKVRIIGYLARLIQQELGQPITL